MSEPTCKKKIWRDFYAHSCNRKAVRDGFCKQHHPDTIAARAKKRDERWNAAREADHQATIERDRETVRGFLAWISAQGHPIAGLSRLGEPLAHGSQAMVDGMNAECANCGDTGLDPAWPHPPCVCPVGLDLRDELDASEPSPGRCAHCPREGEVWYVNNEWLCWKCKEGT